MTEQELGQDWLSATLRQQRKQTGLSIVEAARRIGTSSRRLSNLETGKQVPREEEIRSLAELYHVDVGVRRQLIQAVHDLSTQPPKARAMIARHGAYKMQQRARRIEHEAVRIRSFQPCIIIGLAQTPSYMRAIFSAGKGITPADREKSIATRIARAEILGTDRDISLIHTEGALRWQAHSPAVMIEQLAHLSEVSFRPGVRIGIIPWTTPVSSFPRSGFHIFDSHAVQAATDGATSFFTDPQDVALYEKLWGELEALAVWSGEAREHLERISAEYREFANQA